MKKKVIIIVLCAILVIVGIVLLIFNKDIIKKEKFDGKRYTTEATTAVKRGEVIPEGYSKTISNAVKDIDINSDIDTITSQIGPSVKNKDNIEFVLDSQVKEIRGSESVESLLVVNCCFWTDGPKVNSLDDF